MRALIQRVSEASVRVDDRVVSSIGPGLLIFLGALGQDTVHFAHSLALRISKFRIFPDDDGKMNRSLLDVRGEALVVSQFTLCADLAKGNRPSFGPAADPEKAMALYESFQNTLSGAGLTVKAGVFGADMKVQLINDGPATFMLDEPR